MLTVVVAERDSVVVDHQSLIKFSLISKQTLLSARALLYRQPFFEVDSKDRSVLQAKAKSIVEVLEFNDNYLGKFVRKTSGISKWLSAYAKPLRSADMQDEAGIWYRRILRACPQLQQVDISFSSPEDLTEILEILALLQPAVPDLKPLSKDSSIRDVTFSRRAGGFDMVNWLNYSYLLKTLKRTSIRSLDNIVFDTTYWIYLGPGNQEAQLPFSVKSFQITSLVGSLSVYLPLLPANPAPLKSFAYIGKLSCGASVFGKLPSLLPPTLTTLYLCFLDSTDPIALSEYGTPSDCPSIPIEIFHSFPHLVFLYLCHTAGPSIELLELLVTSSPALSRVFFNGSEWVSTVNPSPENVEHLFPEFRVLTILRQFQHLVEINLGVLPTRRKVKYEDLKNSLQTHGIEVDYDVCKFD
ncbi:hypothetical protein JCM5353_008881 [Sporobolomyces roseus]